MSIRPFLFLPAVSLAFAGAAFAEEHQEDTPPPAFPETEIFLFDYDAEEWGDALTNGRNVTNRAGYDNQPYFTAESSTFVYSRDDGTQTDIWEYDIASGTHTQLTDTPESEFSPTPSPDNRTISMVFERNGSIWYRDRADLGTAVWLLKSEGVTEPIGYFARNFENGDVLYWSRYGYSVAYTNANEPVGHFITGDAVPSTPHLIPGTNRFSFVHRQANEQVWIKEFDPETKAVRPLTTIFGSNANYTWAPDGTILRIEGTKVYRWREGKEGWENLTDLAEFGISEANRIAVSPDGTRVAVVGVPAE